MYGVNLFDIPGIGASTVLSFIAELGDNLQTWKSVKHLASHLGLSPNNKISGGRRISGKTHISQKVLKAALCQAATTLERNQSHLGVFFRRMKARLGYQKAVVATAHKLLVVMYNMITRRQKFQERGDAYSDEKLKERTERYLKQKAKKMGYVLVPIVQEHKDTPASVAC